MIKLVTDWASSYEDLFAKVTPEKQPMLWGDWIHQNTQGLGAAPPYNAATVTLNRAAFPPVSAPPAPSPAPFCNILATAWFAYIASAIWMPPPPLPPFSAITMVNPSMLGINVAKTTLTGQLIAAMSVPGLPFKVQALQISTAFYAATLASGIMLTGLSMAVPPVPLVIPMMPVL